MEARWTQKARTPQRTYYPKRDDLIDATEPSVRDGESTHHWEFLDSAHIVLNADGDLLKVRYVVCLYCGQVWRHS